MDREKVIKAYEDYVNSYMPVTTYGDYVLEMHKAVLALLKEHEKALYELGQLMKERAEEIKRLKTPTAGDNKIPLRW